MSCFNSFCYLPEPPRAWSRVQNECSLVTTSNLNPTELVKFPYTGELVLASALTEKLNMLNKGNILQYKANSSNLTKNMKYSKIAKGQWTNRNTTWATQSTRGYTNPNNNSLKRVGKVDVLINPDTRLPINVNTYLNSVGNLNIINSPITGLPLDPLITTLDCPKFIPNNNEALPNNSGGGSNNIVIPPPPPTPSNNDNNIPSVPPTPPVMPIAIQDGGNLICSVQENICSGFIKSSLSQQLCNPTSDSDVPGRIQDLCWNDGTPTWYPRQRYTMTNSGNKWPFTTGPEDTTTISAVRPFPANIISATFNSNNNTITLKWVQNETCLPVTLFNILQNQQLVKIVDGFNRQTDIIVEKNKEYNYVIIGVTSGNIISFPSNIVTVKT
uniref:Uncharacterized protein n=1 Tax=viral metagenome TaxID=1070528 RepID=A0A6C0KRX2_9ZZZZ